MGTILTKTHKDQQGLASILVTMIIMLVISLIVLGFARLSRREQRQSLDDQLSTQAFYAAESGVNDAVKKLNGGSVDLTKDYSSDCSKFMTDTGIIASNTNKLDGTDNVKYTCLLVNTKPGDLKFDRVTTNNATVTPLIVSDTSPNPFLDFITVAWEDADAGTDVSGCPTPPNFPPLTSWPATCQAGVLRIDLVDTDVYSGDGAGLSRSNLIDDTYTLFLYPQSAGNGTVYDYNSPYNPPYPNARNVNGTVVPVKCNKTGVRRCSITIGASTANNKIMRLKSIYRDSAVTILGDYFDNEHLTFDGVQAQIDATGKANDVLRRIQVRVPLYKKGIFPEFAIQTGTGICKRLQIAVSGGAASTDMASISSCDILNP